ncbi:hypothetical protein [Micromonospora sp. NPDC048830]|uniref:hypothetical protein n=1 Tax=Micromonospora sp. NPDC048830 TaxID=3364257 RepID=UPI00371C5D70
MSKKFLAAVAGVVLAAGPVGCGGDLRPDDGVAQRPSGGEYHTAELSRLELVSLMIGREFGALAEVERLAEQAGEEAATVPVLRATGIGRKGSAAPLDLQINRGEVHPRRGPPCCAAPGDGTRPRIPTPSPRPDRTRGTRPR